MQGRVKIGSLQKNKFEPGRVTAQRVILLLPSLFCNLHWAETELLKTLTSHSFTINTSGLHRTLSAHRRSAGIFIHALRV